MVKFYNSLPASTRLLIHGLLAIVWSAAVTGGEGAYQSFTQSGHLNLPALLVTAWSAFLLYLIPTMYTFVPAHAQQLIKSIQDEKVALYEALQRAQQIKSAQNIPAVQAIQPHVVVQPAIAPALKSEDVYAISAQLAMNLINIAADRASQAATSTAPVAPSTPEPLSVALPVQDAMRHFGDSQVMPAIPAQPFTV